MAFRAGTTSAFYLGNAAGALQNLSGYSDDLSLPLSIAQLDVSTFGNAAMNFIPGIAGGDQISMSGPYDVTVHTQLTALASAGSAAAFIYGPGGSVASQARFAGSVYVANYTTSVGVAGRVSYSASLQISGAVTAGSF
jgi:hypothetical protein